MNLMLSIGFLGLATSKVVIGFFAGMPEFQEPDLTARFGLHPSSGLHK
jgi:hypothetical protein